MIMTTPNEFLQFAKEMGLGRIKSTSSSPSRTISKNENYTSTGLAVLNNLCRLIEQIHQLKAENHRLRAHLDLVEHMDKFQQQFLSKDNRENQPEKHKQPVLTALTYDEEKSELLSPSNSLKIKRSLTNRERKGTNVRQNQEESSLTLPIDQEQADLTDSNLSTSSVPTWNKVRHALRFTLRRKTDSPTSPSLSHVERPIPAISISIESDDDQSSENKYSKKKKKTILNTTEKQPIILGEESDQDDESIQFIRACHKGGRLDGSETSNLSNIDRPDIPSSTNSPFNTANADEENLLTRKQSKIARYRRKIRSKLDTVKRQFSEQNPSSTIRRSPNSYTTTFDDIGSGLNHAILTAQLAPALTKSYQQKMREWETTQKSQFLVNYRRQSLTPKIDLNSNSRKTSLTPVSTETSTEQTLPSSPTDPYSPMIDTLNLELDQNLSGLGPILSPNQRSLIVHQWREIMSEEISLRDYNEYLQQKMILLKELEANLKSLKTNIFCTNHFIRQQSMINIHQIYSSKKSYLPQRCRSLESLISMPASWILAVQSAAYSDVLDGTSSKTTERAILLNKNFFDRLKHFKHNREKFEEDSIKDLQLLNSLKLKSKLPSSKSPLRATRQPTRGYLRKLSLISSSELIELFLPDPIIPLQTIISHVPLASNSEFHPITNEELSTSNHLNKQRKRSRFDLKKSFQRSRSMYMTQFHSWLQRRRQQQHSPIVPRRKSAIEPKASTPSSTPKLFGSPRLARLHQKIFKPSVPSSPPTSRTRIPVQNLDDSDNRSQFERPVRIYFPPLTPPASRHVRINDSNITASENDIEDLSTPVLDRKSLSSSFRITTAKERRESFAISSNIFHQRYA